MSEEKARTNPDGIVSVLKRPSDSQRLTELVVLILHLHSDLLMGFFDFFLENALVSPHGIRIGVDNVFLELSHRRWPSVQKTESEVFAATVEEHSSRLLSSFVLLLEFFLPEIDH